MSALKCSLFRVEWSEPYQQNGRPAWRRNMEANVVCESAERAISLVREHNADPAVAIHSVRRLGTNVLTIVDEAAALKEDQPDD